MTRYRLTADATAPAVSPSLQSYTHTQTTRRKLLETDSSTLTTSAYAPDGADDLTLGDAHHIQFVSDPLPAGWVFTAGDTLKLCIQGLEANNGNNLNVQIFVSVVDSAGTTVRATLRSKVVKSGEMLNSLRSLFFSTTLSGSYTTVANDRLVVEFSVQGTPTAAGGVQGHNASLRWGNSGAGGDLAEDDTQTGTTLNPWIEFATSPPTDHTQTKTDPLGSLDTATRVQTAARAQTDVLGSVDSRSIVAGYVRAQADVLGLLDAASYVHTPGGGGESHTRTVQRILVSDLID